MQDVFPTTIIIFVFQTMTNPCTELHDSKLVCVLRCGSDDVRKKLTDVTKRETVLQPRLFGMQLTLVEV